MLKITHKGEKPASASLADMFPYELVRLEDEITEGVYTLRIVAQRHKSTLLEQVTQLPTENRALWKAVYSGAVGDAQRIAGMFSEGPPKRKARVLDLRLYSPFVTDLPHLPSL